MLKWLRARTEARNAEELEVALHRCELMKRNEAALLASLDAQRVKTSFYKEKVLEERRETRFMREEAQRQKVAADLANNKLDAMRPVLGQARLLAAFAIEAVHEQDVAYKRAEDHGVKAELESIGLAMDAVNGLRLAQRVASARFDVMRSRIRALEAQVEPSDVVEMDIELEDTRPSKPPSKKNDTP